MQEKLINFETAKLAKEKEFFDKTFDGNIRLSQEYFYNYEGKLFTHKDIYYETSIGDLSNCYNAPTQSLLQRWLREVHKIEVFVLPHSITGKGEFYEVVVDMAVTTWSGYGTYEEALEKGLHEALLLIKNEL